MVFYESGSIFRGRDSWPAIESISFQIIERTTRRADPNNREPLWENYNTGSILYQILAKVHALRKQVSIWNLNIVQRYSDDNFYAFTRGNVLACFSNTNSLQRTFTYHEFGEGTKLCNILYDGDCVSVSGGSIYINMGDYPKVYVKK